MSYKQVPQRVFTNQGINLKAVAASSNVLCEVFRSHILNFLIISGEYLQRAYFAQMLSQQSWERKVTDLQRLLIQSAIHYLLSY